MTIFINNKESTSGNIITLIIMMIIFVVIAYTVNYVAVNGINYLTEKLFKVKYLNERYTFNVFVALVLFMVVYGFALDIIHPQGTQNTVIDPVIIYPISLLISLYVGKMYFN